jgi:serine/threonine protein kinase
MIDQKTGVDEQKEQQIQEAKEVAEIVKQLPATIDRYESIRYIGKGSQGQIFFGIDPETGREVAIKKVAKKLSNGQARSSRRVLKEAEIGRILNGHNAIPEFLRMFETEEAYVSYRHH